MKSSQYYKTLRQLLIVVSLATLSAQAYRCDRVPSDLVISEQTKSNNGKYLLEIAGKPEKYVPNEKYQITIQVNVYVYSSSKFRKFLLSLVPQASSDDVTHETGSFELGADGLSKFSHTCPNTIIEANTQPKTQVVLTWVAPPRNSGCVSLRATVIESRERWFADDESTFEGYLTKTLCEDLDEREDELPEILDFCGACDEAKYEMAFQGNWIRNNHPKGFPKDLFTTKFSDIIGASHKQGHEFWTEGAEPSPGLKELAFNGSTRSLESELMDNIDNLHTIIKARGLSYPNITSSSYAIFRVDNENHLVSMVTKMMPSPDWIVGVHSFELCMSNGSWKQSRTVNLYPRDVGIDDALEYTGSEPSRNPNPTVTEITSSEPADPLSPFYDESGEKMKPIAQLHFKLEKIYRKKCDPDRKPPEVVEAAPEKEEAQDFAPSPGRDDHDCKTIGWSKWSNCSAECGKGHMTRNLKFKRNPPPGTCENVAREETQECEATCGSGEKEKHICSNIVWSQWSPCSVTCNKGTKQRYRVQSHGEEDDSEKECDYIEVVECEEECY